MIVTDAIEKFSEHVKRAAQARSRDIRLDMVDATALVSEIANISARLAVYEHQAAASKFSANTQIYMDGGSFD